MEAPELADHQVVAGHSGQNTNKATMVPLELKCPASSCDSGDRAPYTQCPYRTPKLETGFGSAAEAQG